MTMLAYHADPSIKEKYLARVVAHQKADELVKGQYWKGGKGCAVGCTIHDADHMVYEREIGVPVALARLEDTIFEGLPNGEAQAWPTRFLSAINPGADLSRAPWQFLHWLLTEELTGRDHPLVRDAIKRCADVIAPLTKGEPIDASAAWSAESAARSAASAARSAASAAWSAESAESAARSAESAAWSAAWSAASAAWSAESAASAASAAESAESAARNAASAASAASAAYVRMSEKLLALLGAAK